ncbi:hypothetical protein DITRI_Ditri07aG0156000 [Diplodiscus trichospermus]
MYVFSVRAQATAANAPQTCIIPGYHGSCCNEDVLNEIFEKHPDVAQNFQVAYPLLQSTYMDLVVEAYRKIRRLKPECVNDMEKMVRDMEQAGYLDKGDAGLSLDRERELQGEIAIMEA